MIRKIILGIGLVLAVTLLSFFVWVIFPGERVELRQLVPADSLAVVSFELKRSNEGVKDLIKSWNLSPGRRFLLPDEIAVAVVANPEIGYVMLFENSRAAKLVRLFRPWAGRWIGKPYAIFKSVVIVSDNRELLKQVGPGTGKWGRGNGQGMIFIDNRHSELTQVVREFEKKSLFRLFPTVESLEWIEGNFDIGNGGEIKGILMFRLRKKFDVGEVENDIRFLGQTIRRFCKARNLNFAEEMKIGDGYINLNFEVQELREALADLIPAR